MPSSPRSKSISAAAGRVRTRSSSRRKNSSTLEPMPFFPRTTLTTEEQNQMYEAPMPERIDGTWPNLTLSSPTGLMDDSGQHAAISWNDRLSACPSVVMSSMSSMPSLRQAADQYQSLDQRKPSGLKATIRRVFGSKRHRTLVDEECRGYHMSEPTNLMNSERPLDHHISAPASSSHRGSKGRNASGSHRPIPSPEIRDLSSVDTDQPQLKRRNTLPNLAGEPTEAQAIATSPVESIDHDSSEYAQATRKNSTFSDKDKRRSKSINVLSDRYLADEQDVDDQPDQSSDIALWRNSITLAALPKSTQHSSDKAVRETQHHDIQHVPSLEHIIKPSQSFDFGLDRPLEEPSDLEDRVNTLEVKMFDFEYAIAKLQGVEVPKPTLPTKQQKRKNVQQVFSKPSIRSLSTATSGYDRAPITPTDSPITGSPWQETFSTDRSSKATTIRALTRSKSAPRGSLRLTADQFDSLMTIIQDEKDARQLMEMQIVEMQKEIELLQSPVYATINYPEQTLESVKSTAQKKLHRSPPFQFDRPLVRETSRFSMTESEAESLDNAFEDKFETPKQQAIEFNHRRSPLIGVVV